MQNLALIMYLEIDIMCILLLIYIYFKSSRNIERRNSWQFFQGAIHFSMLFVIIDLIWALMEAHILPTSSIVSYLINSIYFIVATSATACWFFFTEAEMGTGMTELRPFMMLSSVPMVLLILLLFVNYQNAILFSFDKQGNFVRGPLNIIAFLIPCLYLILSVTQAMYKALKKENYVHRKHYLTLSLFALMPTGCCMLQLFIPHTPLPCIGIVSGMLLVHINFQEMLVSADPLTKLNNRYQMIRYLSYKLDHINDQKTLYLMIIDLDKFKKINDTYGHVEGDRALVSMADVLRKTASVFGCFVSRYGGDEFIVIHEAESSDIIEDICSFIHEKLEETNLRRKTAYTLRASIGYAAYDNGIRYVPDFIALADKSLYTVKREKNSR